MPQVKSTEEFVERCRQIEWILSDVDGVMTDGGVIMDDRGEHTVRFHIHDGLGVRLWRRSGRRFGILTGRELEVIRLRAEHLAVDALYQGADDKLAGFERFLSSHRVDAGRVCYMGDDLPDLPVLRRAGLAVSVTNAAAEVQAAAHYVTRASGGDGAVREAIEVILKTIDEWETAVSQYVT